ncbi:hypothetical protein CPB84DRAFT_1621855, partial [Gymnopilus junonius]
AGIWSSNTNFETGNFVPRGERAPSTYAFHSQSDVGFKCDVSHTLDTSIDESLWDCVQICERYIKNFKDFNRSGRERSRWQDGSDRRSYTISSKLFVRKSTKVAKPDFTPHEWLTRGVQAQKRMEYVINPERPLYYDLVDNSLVKLDNAEPPYYRRGDIVWFVFKLTFFVARENWSSEIVPLEFVRV